MEYSLMPCEVEFTDEFEEWWDGLSEDEQDSINYYVRLLQQFGIDLKRPAADTLKGSKISNLRELRCQHQGRPYRVLYVFDPRRSAILLIGGDKTGNERWYRENIPLAERIYENYLKTLRQEGLID
jgi:hypothetical protein